MHGFTTNLDARTELLIAVGAAVACGCRPCLHNLVEKARSADVPARSLKSAAIIGQFVKDQPAAKMRALADELLGTHLDQGRASENGCPLQTGAAGANGQCAC
ncbi:MAG: carboxymuconolactone decarboxylase family protein [Desulfosarcinaceae bacterium]|jgi:AhpD family alkylhydroperoxidase